jgi:hypothetical protein
MYQYDIWYMSYTRCRIDTINSPDDGHMAAQNMYRIVINIHEKELCVKLVICKDYTDHICISFLYVLCVFLLMRLRIALDR